MSDTTHSARIEEALELISEGRYPAAIGALLELVKDAVSNESRGSEVAARAALAQALLLDNQRAAAVPHGLEGQQAGRSPCQSGGQGAVRFRAGRRAGLQP